MITENWLSKYRESIELTGKSVDVLTGFNANIDKVYKVSEIDIDLEDTEPELKDKVSQYSDLRSSLLYCIENGENHELKLDMDPEFEGETFIGGQGGIMANFLSKTGNGVIFYTPLLSEKLADKIDEKVLYPVIEGDFQLKNVKDCSNTDRTKINHIFEFDEKKSGRLILSDSLKGFGPYFRKGIEDKLEVIQDNVDCALLSGFHNVEGNKEAKVKKAAEQVGRLEIPVHMEYAHKDDKTSLNIVKEIIPEIDSIGLDESEFRKLADLLHQEKLGDRVSLGEAFRHSKDMIDTIGISRVHLHTYRYHVIVTKDNYPHKPEKIQKSMLYGEIAAIEKADKGEIPDIIDIEEFDFENVELNGFKELEHFGDYFDIEDFVKDGIAEIDNYIVVAIPTLIHDSPERTVGMGDIISSATFTSELI